MNRMITAASVAAVLCSLGLAACSNHESATLTAATPPVEAPLATPPPAPPPTLAEQHEMGLTSLGAQVTGEGLKVTLDSADFGSGNSEFKPENTERIEHVAGLLKARPSLRVIVAGYTDDRGSADANKRLSEERARSVRDYLVQQDGAEESRIEARGMGEADPVASNDSEEGRTQNRRVELRIVDDSGGYEQLASD